MTPTRQDGAASIKALLGMVLIGAAAHAELAYLQVAGPPPLRVAAAKPSAAATVIALEKSAAGSLTNPPPTLATKPAGLNTNCFLADTNVAAPQPLIGANQAPAADDTFAVPVFNLPSSSSMSMTPQMLATYFRPISLGTNGAAIVAGPFSIGFVPPFTEPDKSSHAEYNVK